MDFSFDIPTPDGSRIMVALSQYDASLIEAIGNDNSLKEITLYDVSLMREGGNGYVGYKTLKTITTILANVLDDNPDAVLCFYCDARSEINRSHFLLSPQEYRSRLFTKMFELYLQARPSFTVIHKVLEIKPDANPQNKQFVHFICSPKHYDAVNEIALELMAGK